MGQVRAWFDRHSADLVALIVVTIWGSSFVIRKAALEQFDVHAYNFLRFSGMMVLALYSQH